MAAESCMYCGLPLMPGEVFICSACEQAEEEELLFGERDEEDEVREFEDDCAD